MNSIRVILAVCVASDYVMEQLDADTAFLNSGLSGLVYMDVPHGVPSENGMICKLLKAIYGLKQAASAWNKTIHRVFQRNGFKSCGADQCVYVKRSNNVYWEKSIEVKEALKNAFKMKELGTAKFILGMEIDHNKNDGALMIKQTRYIDDVVERFGQLNSKATDNPCASNLKLSKTQSPGTVEERAEMQPKPYRSLIGCLLYITTSISVPREPWVATLACGYQSATLSENDTKAWDRVQETKNGLKFEAFTDADWGSNIDDRRSVSGIMVMIGNAPVVFKSIFHRTVALSSAEAEYMALSLCILWLRAMLKDMCIEQKVATQIGEDNQGAIALAKNAGYNSRTKYVDIKYHFTRENVERRTIKVDYIDTKRQLVDLLTKALGTKTLNYLSNASGIKMKITAQ
ncbi:LOW QUALITY PROTEIN: Integrase, catalytic core protein [Phytophthora megakarya]|uniref:Integrase, catalytic core protein n=1 Tax=Phytophthora megakarya TaxID=4795 RepID=A0A225WPV0_9STRA|nr:LOW QUALITY PROTEIN: Integrase, catalytic core protein [Phytophthora megakarya]